MSHRPRYEALNDLSNSDPEHLSPEADYEPTQQNVHDFLLQG